MRLETRIGLIAFLLAFSVSFAVSAWTMNGAIIKRISDQHRVVSAVEVVTEVEREELVTGLCTFGDCPVADKVAVKSSQSAYLMQLTSENVQINAEETAENVQNEPENSSNNVQVTVYAEELFQDGTEVVAESATTVAQTETAYEDDNFDGYIGRMYVTGYTAEEGFPLYSATSSGYGVRPGYCAMNSDQRRALGISYGDQIYVEGLGTYTVMDCGCSWGVVDIWLYTNAEAYAITGYYNVYYA